MRFDAQATQSHLQGHDTDVAGAAPSTFPYICMSSRGIQMTDRRESSPKSSDDAILEA